MLDKSYYDKTDEIIEHYGRKASSLILSCRTFRRNTVICRENSSLM